MDAAEMAELISHLIHEFGAEGCGQELSVRSFAHACILTSDEGLVVRTDRGEEFQITVVQSH